MTAGTTRRTLFNVVGTGVAASSLTSLSFCALGPAAAVPARIAATMKGTSMNARDDMHWVGTWATPPDPMEGIALGGQTLRMITRISIGGTRLRVRISNAYGACKLTVGAAHIGIRRQGADLVSGSGRPLTFNGSPSTIIPSGALAVSDPVDLNVPPLADLAVSVFLPGEVPESFRLTGHDNGHQTNYLSLPGDFAPATNLPI